MFACVVCGQDVYPYQNSKSWLGKYRILYSSPKGTCLWRRPVRRPSWGPVYCAFGYAARCNDPGCRIKGVGVMTHNPVKKRHGFLFHEACWVPLEKSHHP